MEVEKAQPEDFEGFNSREGVSKMDPRSIEAVCQLEDTYKVVEDDEIVVLCGIIPAGNDPARGQAWALVNDAAPPRKIVRAASAMRKWLNDSPYRRVEITVNEHFVAGQNWAEMMGFEVEGIARKFGINGDNHFYYAFTK